MMSRVVRTAIWLGACSAAALPGAGRAQDVRYAYRAGDTARFAESIEVHGTNSGRGGRQTVGFKRESKIAFAFSGGDSIRAWYDEISVEATGPAGLNRPRTDGIIRVPFVLHVQPDGYAKTVVTPRLPDIVRQFEEIYPQFDDFFVTLPTGELAIGATRTDTLHRRETSANRSVAIRRIVLSRVERDTVIGTAPAVIIAIETALRIQVTGKAPTGSFSANLVLNGKEHGSAIVTRSGMLLHRSRTGEAQGSTTYTGRGAEVSVGQTYSYRSTVKAIDK